MNLTILEKVEQTSSKNEKKALLAGLDRKEDLPLLKLVLDPAVTFGVTVDGKAMVARHQKNEGHPKAPKIFWNQLLVLCHQLKNRDLTGNAAKDSIEEILDSAPDEKYVVWACRVLNKDLRCDFSMSTLNKVFPNTITKFAVQLAEPFDPDKHELNGEFSFEPKLDGLRMVVVEGKAYTRNGKEILTVGHILEQLRKVAGVSRWVFDGEVMGTEDFDTNSGATRRKSKGTNESLVYNVFDCVELEEWNDRSLPTLSYIGRRENLDHILGGAGTGHPNVKIVPWKKLKNPTGADLFQLRDELIKQGFEGGMLKKLDAPYVFKRSDAVLKFKDFVDLDAPIVDFLEGKNDFEGSLGAILVEHESPEGKVRSKVGSGFSVEQRGEIWKNKKKYLGKTVECQYQNFGKNGRMRFPVFVKFRPDKD